MSNEITQSEVEGEKPYVKAKADPLAPQSRPPIYEKTDRGRAMLTKTDRELLLGEKEYDSDQGLRNARHRIREHVRKSIPDIHLIAERLEIHELEQLVERQWELDKEGDYRGFQLSPGVLLLAVQLMYIEANETETRSFIEHVESQVGWAVRSIVERANNNLLVTETDVNISMTKQEDEDEIVDDLIRGNPTMSAVSTYLLNFGTDHIQKILRERDTVIETSEGPVIGPDHDLFDGFDSGVE